MIWWAKLTALAMLDASDAGSRRKRTEKGNVVHCHLLTWLTVQQLTVPAAIEC